MNPGLFASLVCSVAVVAAGDVLCTLPVIDLRPGFPQAPHTPVPSPSTPPTTATGACTMTNPLVLSDDFSVGNQWTTAFTRTDPALLNTAANSAGGGNTGGYRRMEHHMSVPGTIFVYHSFSVPYDPSRGAIDHVNYSEDQIEFLPPSPRAAVGWGFFFEQGGNRYTKSVGDEAYTHSSWQPGSIQNLTAADFPGADFSVLGKPITFGFFRATTGGSAFIITHGIDNWRVEIFCR